MIKIRSGMVFNNRLKYTFEMAARVVLEQLSLRPKMLYACFGEATLLAQAQTQIGNNSNHGKFNFMDTNSAAMDYISAGFSKAEYALVTRVLNNQKQAKIEIRDFGGGINLRDKRNLKKSSILRNKLKN